MDLFDHTSEHGAGFPGSAGDLHSDVFGHVTAGHSPFSVAEIHPGSPGVLHSDVFGHVTAGDSPFPVGEL